MAAKFLEDYVGVDDLIKQMNEQYPEGRLVSEIVEKTDKMVVFKTSFYTKDNVSPKCTGHGSKYSTEDHWLEKAEQKSRGRCLRVLLGGAEPTREEMEGIVPSKTATPNKKSLDEKVKDLEAEGLVEDISMKAQAVMDNIKDFAMEITNQDLDLARNYTAQALGSMGMSKTEVSINNLQSVKNKIQDIATMARAEIDKGE
jgi:guanylate kinase